jgi:hypothetical protein
MSVIALPLSVMTSLMQSYLFTMSTDIEGIDRATSSMSAITLIVIAAAIALTPTPSSQTGTQPITALTIGSIECVTLVKNTFNGNLMSKLDALQSVQFVTIKGRRLAVLNDDWEALVEWLETLGDLQITRTAFAQLQAAGGDRERAGWLKWDDVKQELG